MKGYNCFAIVTKISLTRDLVSPVFFEMILVAISGALTLLQSCLRDVITAMISDNSFFCSSSFLDKRIGLFIGGF